MDCGAVSRAVENPGRRTEGEFTMPAAPDAAGGIPSRTIPKSGERIPVIGLGTWQAFDIGSRADERAGRRAVLEKLFAAGGSVIDSSPMYGRAEAVVGDLLAETKNRERAFVATKVWTSGRSAGIEQMNASFQKLRVDRIDLMQVHNLVDWRSHVATLEGWKKEGRVRYIGLTHYTESALSELADIVECTDIDFLQFLYSLDATAAEKRLLPLCADRGIATLVNRPFDGGDMLPRMRGRNLPPLAAELGCATWAQFALKYILAHPAVNCVIPGTGNPRHIEDNLAAARGRLPTEPERAKMLAAWRAL
jgi:diketogulonate reductase-like aldo/keto reductase